MGLRFRRVVVLAPGIRLNLSKSGPGVTLDGNGPPPGLDGGVGLALEADGTITLHDDSGVPLSPAEVRRVRAEHGEALRRWLTELCDEWNRRNDEVLNPHYATPAPDLPLAFEPRPFTEPPPEPYVAPTPTVLDRSWPPYRKKFEAMVAAGKQAYEEELWRWRRRKAAHDAEEAQRRKDLEIGRYGDRVVMEAFLTERLTGLAWPTEVVLAFEISLDSTVVFLDLRVPEIDVVPAREAGVAARGLRIRYTDLSEAQIRRAYAWHIHAVLFRLIGETFTALPGVERVIASAFAARPGELAGGAANGATGASTGIAAGEAAPWVTEGESTEARGECLISAEVEREVWSKIDFAHLPALDLLAAFERFGLRRKLTKHGAFTAIEPLGAAPAGGLFD